MPDAIKQERAIETLQAETIKAASALEDRLCELECRVTGPNDSPVEAAPSDASHMIAKAQHLLAMLERCQCTLGRIGQAI